MATMVSDHYFQTLGRTLRSPGRIDRFLDAPWGKLVGWIPYTLLGLVSTPLFLWAFAHDEWYPGAAPDRTLALSLAVAAAWLVLSVAAALALSRRWSVRQGVGRLALLFFVTPGRAWCWVCSFVAMLIIRWPLQAFMIALLAAAAFFIATGNWFVVALCVLALLMSGKMLVTTIRPGSGTSMASTGSWLLIGPLVTILLWLLGMWTFLVGIIGVIAGLLIACLPMAGPGWLALQHWGSLPWLGHHQIPTGIDAVAFILLFPPVLCLLPLLCEQMFHREGELVIEEVMVE